MMFRIQENGFEVKYILGQNIPLCHGDTIPGLVITIHQLHLSATPTRIEEIPEETQKDPFLELLSEQSSRVGQKDEQIVL